MGPPNHFMEIMLPNMQVEFLYILIAAILLLIIYFKTKEFYELTKYKGIKYFRNAFLFLAIAHLFRLVSSFFVISNASPIRMMDSFDKIVVGLGFSLFAILSFLGILFLAYSSIHKKIQKGLFSKKYSLYIIAVILFIPIFLFGNMRVFLIMQTLLILLAFIMSSLSFKKESKRKRKHGMHLLYGLFLLFWIVGMFAAEINPFYLGIKIIAYLIALIMILLILLRIIKITRIKEK